MKYLAGQKQWISEPKSGAPERELRLRKGTKVHKGREKAEPRRGPPSVLGNLPDRSDKQIAQPSALNMTADAEAVTAAVCLAAKRRRSPISSAARIDTVTKC